MKILYSLITAPPSKTYGGENHHITLAKYLKKEFNDVVSFVSYDVSMPEEIWRKFLLGKFKKNYKEGVYKVPIENLKVILRNPISFCAHNIFWKMCSRKSFDIKGSSYSTRMYYILKAVNILSDYYSLRIGYFNPKLVKEILESYKPEIVHVYGIHLFWLPYILHKVALKYERIKTVIWTLYHHFIPYERFLFSRPKILKSVNDAHLVIASTNYEKRIIYSMLKERGYSRDLDSIYVLPVPIDVSQFMHPPNDLLENLREYIGNPDYIILTMTLNRAKGSLNVLRSLVEYELHGKIAFVSFGRSTPDELIEFKEITKKLPSNISAYYLGYVDEHTKASLYSISDVFAMPSIADSFGIAYAEAWYYNTPVIADKNPVMEEVIGNMVRGILVDRNNVKEIQEAIRLLIEDKNLSNRLVTNGKRYLMHELNAKQVTRKIRRLYQKISEH